VCLLAMERACLICRTDLAGSRSDARFCSAKCRKRWHRRPADLRVEFVSDPCLPPSDEQILHERTLLATARRQARICRCDSPLVVKDIDGHDQCFKCSWPIERRRLRRPHWLFRLIARLRRNSGSQPVAQTA
jgi:hypothetical protein